MLGIKERGSTKIFRRKNFVSWWRIFRRATLLCSVSEIFRERRTLWIKRGGGGYQDFPSNRFSLTLPKSFAGESFTVSLISGIEKC